MMALGAVAVVFVIGLSLLSGLPATARVSNNFVDRDEALYLADSAIVETLYRLRHPTRAEVWGGVTDRRIPGLNGSYDVIITDLGDDHYQITAIGYANGRSGQVVAHRSSMTVYVERDWGNIYRMKAPAVIGAGIVVPSGMRVNGDMYVNGQVTNNGRVDGTIYASSTVNNPGQADAVEENTTAVDMPQGTVQDFLTYEYEGETYQSTALTSAEAMALPAVYRPATSSNPLGIVVVLGNFRLARNMRIIGGSLLVKGSLFAWGRNIEIQTAAENQIGLLAENLMLYGSRTKVRVEDGPAIVTNYIFSSTTAKKTELDFRAGLVLGRGLIGNFDGTIEVKYPALDSQSTVNVTVGQSDTYSGTAAVQILDYRSSASAF